MFMKLISTRLRHFVRIKCTPFCVSRSSDDDGDDDDDDDDDDTNTFANAYLAVQSEEQCKHYYIMRIAYIKIKIEIS